MKRNLRTSVVASAVLALGLSLTACDGQLSERTPEASKTTNTNEVTLKSMVPSTERDSLVLVELFNQTKGPKWWKKAGWLNDRLEDWHGVKVEVVDGERRVVELRLGAHNLQGNIPAVLGQLSELRVLDLKWNERLGGTIPKELFDLKQLEVLNLRMTAITGELSPRIGELTELDTLNLRTFTYDMSVRECVRNKNLLTGELPKEIGNLKKMRFLDLGRQGFTGAIPHELGNCTALEDLGLDECDFTGELPEGLKHLKNLRVLDLSYNMLQGEIPEWIGELENLEALWLKFNRFSGSLPASIGNLQKLHTAVLNNNRLSGELPQSISQMSSLFFMALDNNQLTGAHLPIFAPLYQQGKLNYVAVDGNNFSDQPAPSPAPEVRPEYQYDGLVHFVCPSTFKNW